MNLNDVVFLASQTTRSQAYAQAMFRSGIRPGNTIIFGPEDSCLPGQLDSKTDIAENVRTMNGIQMPDLSESLITTVMRDNWKNEVLVTKDVNDPQIWEILNALKPGLVIYSGFGGQIVSSKLLDIAPFLHIHSGWLPQYRGSTTLYYSWLKDGYCGASAILLAEQLDMGQIICRQKYAPPVDVHTDHLYDGSIRADLLVNTLKKYSQEEGFHDMHVQDEATGHMYYVIHPVLKHLALVQVDNT